MPSMSREISAWVETLTFEDLPPNVVDRAKGVTLQALSSALLGHEFAEARQAVAMMQEEEAGGGGAATCLVTGTKLTKVAPLSPMPKRSSLAVSGIHSEC